MYTTANAHSRMWPLILAPVRGKVHRGAFHVSAFTTETATTYLSMYIDH